MTNYKPIRLIPWISNKADTVYLIDIQYIVTFHSRSLWHACTGPLNWCRFVWSCLEKWIFLTLIWINVLTVTICNGYDSINLVF